MGETPRLRRAESVDSLDASGVYLRARHAAVPAISPLAHADEAVVQWFARLLAEREVWLAESVTGVIVGVMVLEGDWLEQLYVDPSWTRQGLGRRLLDVAKSRRPGGLQLWCFESNSGARRFYERHGFVAVECTDGSSNEEGSPDIRYAWRPEPTSAAQ